jgi:hypothetical protein
MQGWRVQVVLDVITRCDFVAYGQGMQKTLQLFLDCINLDSLKLFNLGSSKSGGTQ